MSETRLPLSPAAIRDGHRQLLETLREFRFTVEPGASPDSETLRALVAFLRQEVPPFSRQEEAALAAWAAREATAFEHAFLEAEIDGLARAVDRLHGLAAGPEEPPRRQAAAEVLRRVYRIEAALELHVLKFEDDGVMEETMSGGEDRGRAPVRPPLASKDAATRSGTTVARRPRSLAPDEIEEILRRNFWGVLATARDARPYAVPVVYGYDGSAFYVATGPGRKLTNLLANPVACLTVVEVDNGGTGWRSVVATGEARPLADLGARLAALNVLRRQAAGRRVSSARDAARLASASVVRIVPDERAGRARGG